MDLKKPIRAMARPHNSARPVFSGRDHDSRDCKPVLLREGAFRSGRSEINTFCARLTCVVRRVRTPAASLGGREPICARKRVGPVRRVAVVFRMTGGGTEVASRNCLQCDSSWQNPAVWTKPEPIIGREGFLTVACGRERGLQRVVPPVVGVTTSGASVTRSNPLETLRPFVRPSLREIPVSSVACISRAELINFAPPLHIGIIVYTDPNLPKPDGSFWCRLLPHSSLTPRFSGSSQNCCPP